MECREGGGGEPGSAHSARLEIRQRNPGTAYVASWRAAGKPPRRRAMLLDPLARTALPAKVIGQLRGIIIHDMYHTNPDLESRLNVTMVHDAEARATDFMDHETDLFRLMMQWEIPMFGFHMFDMQV